MSYFLPYEFGPGSPRPVYEQITAALAMAADTSGAVEAQRFDEDRTRPRLKEPYRWPSTLPQLDSRCGGFPGVTYLVAPPKAGKSILGLASALEAAATMEWRVLVFNAELTRGETDERVDRYIAAHPGAEDALPFVRVIHLSRGFNLEALHQAILCELEPDDLRLLLVVDSVSRIADVSGQEYFHVLRDLGVFLMTARRISEGVVSALVVSEMNQRGTDKGDRGSYLSDMLVKMKPAREAGYVDIDVKYARGAGEGPVGKFLRDWQRGEFRREEDVLRDQDRGLELVEGGLG